MISERWHIAYPFVRSIQYNGWREVNRCAKTQTCISKRGLSHKKTFLGASSGTARGAKKNCFVRTQEFMFLVRSLDYFGHCLGPLMSCLVLWWLSNRFLNILWKSICQSVLCPNLSSKKIMLDSSKKHENINIISLVSLQEKN